MIQSSNNVTWIQNGNFAFTNGSILLKNVNMISGVGTTFAYQTNQTSTIAQDGQLILDFKLRFRTVENLC